MKRSLPKILLLITLIVAVNGCDASPEDTKNEVTTTITDIMGRTVTIDRPVKRVVLEGSERLIEFSAVYGKGFQNQIIGWGPDLKNYDINTYQRYIQKFPKLKDVPVVGSLSKGTFSVEKVISLRPDVVFLRFSQVDLHEGTRTEMKKLQKAGIPIIVVDFWKKPIQHTRKSIKIMGQVLNKQDRSQKILDFYNSRLKKVFSKLKSMQRKKPEVYLEIGMGGPKNFANTYGNAGWGVLIEKARGRNIAQGIVSNYGRINPEYLLNKNPDVIILTGRSGFTKKGSIRMGYGVNRNTVNDQLRNYTKRPGWDELKAVRNDRIYGIFHGFLFSIYNFTAVEALARAFYPETLRNINPEDGLEKFHRRFQPISDDGVWTHRFQP